MTATIAQLEVRRAASSMLSMAYPPLPLNQRFDDKSMEMFKRDAKVAGDMNRLLAKFKTCEAIAAAAKRGQDIHGKAARKALEYQRRTRYNADYSRTDANGETIVTCIGAKELGLTLDTAEAAEFRSFAIELHEAAQALESQF